MTLSRICAWDFALGVLVAGIAHCQVSASATPEPMAVLKHIPVKDIGIWDIRLCDDGVMPVELPEERVYMAFPQVHFLTATSARIVLAARVSRNKKQIAADIITYGLIGAAQITSWGPVAASKTVIGGLTTGAGLAAVIRDKLQSQVPSVQVFEDNLLTGTITLQPGGCVTRSAFAAKTKAPQTVQTVIPLVPGSIPNP